MIGQHRHKTCTSVCFTFFYGRLSRLHSVLLIPPGSLFYVESRIVSIFLKRSIKLSKVDEEDRESDTVFLLYTE